MNDSRDMLVLSHCSRPTDAVTPAGGRSKAVREMSSWPAGQLGLLSHNSSALVRGRAGAQLMHTLLLVCAVAPRGVPSPMERKHGSVARSVAGARYGDAAQRPRPAAATSHCVSTATTVPNKAPVLQLSMPRVGPRAQVSLDSCSGVIVR